MNHFKLSKMAAAIAVLGGLGTLGAQAYAAAPKVGTSISNIATATYVDDTGSKRTVSSNEVKTVVAQVGSFILEDDRTAISVPNGKVLMSHTLTNTGNGPDTFQFSLSNEDGDTFDFSTYAVYIDRNGDGVPDDRVDYSQAGNTITVEAGKHIQVLVEVVTPSIHSGKEVKSGDTGKITLTATSTKTEFYPVDGNNQPVGISDSDTDTVTVTDGATIRVTKAASVASAKAGDVIKYTLTFTNTGNATAKNLSIFDILPANVQYAGKATYSGSRDTLTDAIDTDAYHYNADERRLMLNVASLAPNQTGKLEFEVTVLATKESTVENIAYVDPDGKPNPGFDPDEPVGPNNQPTIPLDPTDTPDPEDPNNVPSNPSVVTVSGIYKGSVNDTKSSDFSDNEPKAGNGDDKLEVSGQQGVPVEFGKGSSDGDLIVVHNRGDRVDTFNLTVDTSKLPEGAVVTILKSDGATPLTDTNGDGIPDTGPIQPDASDNYVVRVTLPSGYTTTTPVDMKLTSTSVSQPTVDVNGETKPNADTLTLEITKVEPASVDAVNRPDSGTDKGTGTGDGTPVTEQTTPPGVPTEFDLTVVNTGTTPDNYELKVPNVPENWTVEIFEKDPDTGECKAKVTNSGNIKPGEDKSFCVVVTPPPGTPAGEEEKITVEIKSPSSGAKDNITYEVTVEEARGLKFTPDNTGTVAPGGTIEYKHVLTNTGNVVEGATDFPLDLKLSSTLVGVNASIYVDLNNDGVLDLNELVIGTTDTQRTQSFKDLLAKAGDEPGLSTDESVNIYVKVEAPASATGGQSDTTIVTLTPAASTNTSKTPAPLNITDLTIINLGQVRLVKTQALSEDCNSVPAATQFKQEQITAKPGACVYYRIVATNEGNAKVENIVFNDKVPSYTTYYANSAVYYNGNVFTQDNLTTVNATEANGNITHTVAELEPTEAGTLEFGVQVDK